MPAALRSAPASSRPRGSRRPVQRRLRPQRATETPAVVAFQQYARFLSIDPDENRRRFYLLSWHPSLFGGGLLMRTWGRIGTHGSSRATSFADRDHAQPVVERLIRRRLQRRYELTAWT